MRKIELYNELLGCALRFDALGKPSAAAGFRRKAEVLEGAVPGLKEAKMKIDNEREMMMRSLGS